MRHTGTVPRNPLAVWTRPKLTFTKVASWTLYGSGALALLFGLLVWPGNVHAVSDAHRSTGWLVVASLWTLAVIAARSGVPRRLAWLAGVWGLVAALAAMGQYALPAGTWITAVHVATGIGAIGGGAYLIARIRPVDAAKASDGSRPIEDAAAEFLANKRIAVTGVSRKPAQHGSNVVYRRLRERGYQVFAVNPNAAEVEGDLCFPDLKSIPGGVDAVVIATSAARALATMRECAELGIQHVWMHRALGAGSVSEEAAAWGRQSGMRVIAGGCPLMFDPAADAGHKIMRPLLTLTGKVPRLA